MNVMSCFFLVLVRAQQYCDAKRDTLPLHYQFSTLTSSDIIDANGEFAG
jgi:hypothetical protein